MNINKAIVVGHLTRDPEIRYTQSGTPVASFSVATNRTWTNRQGEKQEEVEYHNVSVFDRQATPCAEYLRTGSQVYVEGRLQTRTFERAGQKHYRTQIIAERVQFGSRKATEDNVADFDDSDEALAGTAASTNQPIEDDADENTPF